MNYTIIKLDSSKHEWLRPDTWCYDQFRPHFSTELILNARCPGISLLKNARNFFYSASHFSHIALEAGQPECHIGLSLPT
jgi:hypothetical protein